jgi:hypothetical protein
MLFSALVTPQPQLFGRTRIEPMRTLFFNIIVLLFATLSNEASAQLYYLGADKLQAQCISAQMDNTGTPTPDSALKLAFCTGFILGVADSLTVNHQLCIPTGTPTKVIIGTFNDFWLTRKADDLKKATAAGIVGRGLLELYPCGTK